MNPTIHMHNYYNVSVSLIEKSSSTSRCDGRVRSSLLGLGAAAVRRAMATLDYMACVGALMNKLVTKVDYIKC